MQLNIYVPKDEADTLEALNQAAKRTGRSKNDIVLTAVKEYLSKEPPVWKAYNLGVFEMPSREEIYEEVIERHYRPES